MLRKSPLLSAPFFSLAMVQLDWLHIADIGITLELLGSVFFYVIGHKLPGNQAAACKELFSLMKAYYDTNSVASQLTEVKPSTLKSQGKPFPKLRAKGADSRALVPFCQQLCVSLMDPRIPLEKLLLEAATHLRNCYKQLHSEQYNPRVLAQEAHIFATSYVEANRVAGLAGKNLCKVKPKLHLFCELCYCCKSNPSSSWCYRDEDYAGKAAVAAARKGGKNSVKALATSYFTRWACLYTVPVL